MIKARIYRKNQKICGFVISGHAGYAQAGEDMFDIAKRYAASPEAIAAANDTGSGILEAPQRLLIPSAT